MNNQDQTTIETAMANAVCPKVATDHVPTAPDKPTIEALLKRWIKWAFVPSSEPHCDNNRVFKHEIQEFWRDYDISTSDFVHAMLAAGFRCTQDGESFYVADSPARETYYSEYVQWIRGTVHHPLLRPDPTTEFNALLPMEKERLLAWIEEYIHPTEKAVLGYLLCDVCCRMVSGVQYAAFCGAMLAAGYQPVDPAACDWRFRVAVDQSRLSMMRT